jgi:hypothetical protein
MANLADLIEARFGVKTEAADNRSTSSIGTSVATVLPNDPKRLAAVIVNLSAVAVYVAPYRDVGASKGIRLAPSGGTLSLIWDEDFDVTGWEWFGIADAAASALFTLEVLAR